jgi:hypothetical protein
MPDEALQAAHLPGASSVQCCSRSTDEAASRSHPTTSGEAGGAYAETLAITSSATRVAILTV